MTGNSKVEVLTTSGDESHIVLPRLTTQNLSELFSQYVRQTEQHERFGQYVMNRTRFAIDNVHGVNVWNEKDANKVYNALFTYLCEIQA